MGSAVKHVCFVEINPASEEPDYVDDATLLLFPLAKACPAVQELKLTGGISQGLLAAVFRTTMFALSSVEASKVPDHALSGHQSMLPNFTHLLQHDGLFQKAHIPCIAWCLA